MKVRVKKTGEVLNVAEYAKVATDHCNDWGNPIEYSLDEIEIIPDEPQEAETPAVDWEQRRYEIARDVLVSRIDSENERILSLINGQTEATASGIVKQLCEALIKSSVVYADELIKELRKEAGNE